MVLEAQLQQCDGEVLGKALAVHSQDRGRVARLYGLAQLLYFCGTLDESVALGWLLLISLDLQPCLGN